MTPTEKRAEDRRVARLARLERQIRSAELRAERLERRAAYAATHLEALRAEARRVLDAYAKGEKP